MHAQDLAQPATVSAELVDAFERHSARAWPAPDVTRMHGWELRLTPGSRSRRINSLNAIEPTPGRFEDVLGAARRACVDRGLACIVRLTPRTPREALERLAQRGGLAVGQTLVMHAELDGGRIPLDCDMAPEVGPEWLSGMAAAGAAAEERALIARLLAPVRMPQAFGIAREGDAALAFGRIAVEDGVAGVFNVATAPEARRRGLGRRLMEGLMAWSWEKGARTVYLQVLADNQPAVGLYTALGFREAYRYAYLTA